MATARKAKKPITHFGVKGQKKFVSVLCCFLLHIDLFTHSADMMAQGPSSHLYSHSTHGTLIKRLADRFTGFTVNTSHQGQSILQSSILAYWTLSGIDSGTKSTTSTTTGHQFPSGIGTPAVGLTPPPPNDEGTWNSILRSSSSEFPFDLVLDLSFHLI